MRRLRRCLPIFLFLLLGRFALGSSAPVSIRVDVVAPDISSFDADRMAVVARSVLSEELDWLFVFDAKALDSLVFVLDDTTRDDDTFSGASLYRTTFSHGSKQFPLAFLVRQGERFEEVWSRTLRACVRENLPEIFSVPGAPTITHALPSGYWVATGDEQLRKGRRVPVKDVLGRTIALMTVADRFVHQEEGQEDTPVVELLPVWASRPITKGMGLSLTGAGSSWSIAPTVSSGRAGARLGYEGSLPSSLFRFSAAATGAYRWDDAHVELMLLAGISRGFSFGELTRDPDRIGQWWTNLHLDGKVHVGFGIELSDSTQVRFLYGADAQIEFSHHDSSRFFWGVGIGYRYVAVRENGSVSSIQSNERGITLSPTIGWLW